MKCFIINLSLKMTKKSMKNKSENFNPRSKSKSANVDYFDGRKDVSNLAAGDSYYIADFMRKGRAEIFENLINEIEWDQMFNLNADSKASVQAIPRMVSGQTYKDRRPIYRMPGCNERNIRTRDWTPTVAKIRDMASKEVDQELNHCVCTLFRDSSDSLGFHKDKLLDLKENTLILSISFGDVREITFVADEKNRKHKQVVTLQPGSLLAIGPKTNKNYVHGILKSEKECGPRISLSMRTISSFVTSEGKIVGDGEEFQEMNYPFIKSYDKEEEYTEEVKEEMERLREESKRRLSEIIEKFK